MSFIVLEDQKKPLPKRGTAVFRSIRIVKPLLKLARFTFRSSRFLIARTLWIVRGDRPAAQPLHSEEPIAEVTAHNR
ncbi:MAG TPA: hypothetical protein VFV52_13565 [Bacilli bacterium]|nr:hypothetical protein [Bacilli bacterium]